MQTPKLLPNTTPFPNRLLDEVMPALKDTEWRLLCVVVRQTLGWTDGTGRRKEQDWLTHSQLKARTNRASAAVSQGVEGLVRRGLIEVRNEAGELLLTPQERRRARGQLFYRLPPRRLTTTSVTTMESEAAFSQSGLRKAKTTKETGTKNYLENPLSFSESERFVSVAEDVFGIAQDVLPDDPAIAAFVERYRELYRRHLEREAPAVYEGDYRLLSHRLEKYGAGELERLLPAFFISDFGYVRRRDYSLRSFLDTLTILRLGRVELARDSRFPGSGPALRSGSTPGCS